MKRRVKGVDGSLLCFADVSKKKYLDLFSDTANYRLNRRILR